MAGEICYRSIKTRKAWEGWTGLPLSFSKRTRKCQVRLAGSRLTQEKVVLMPQSSSPKHGTAGRSLPGLK